MNLKTKRIIVITVFTVLLESILLLTGWIIGLIPYEPRMLFAFLILSFAYGEAILDIYFKGIEKKRFLKIHLSFYIFSGIVILLFLMFYFLYQLGALELTIFNVIYLVVVIIFCIYFIIKEKETSAD